MSETNAEDGQLTYKNIGERVANLKQVYGARLSEVLVIGDADKRLASARALHGEFKADKSVSEAVYFCSDLIGSDFGMLENLITIERDVYGPIFEHNVKEFEKQYGSATEFQKVQAFIRAIDESMEECYVHKVRAYSEGERLMREHGTLSWEDLHMRLD